MKKSAKYLTLACAISAPFALATPESDPKSLMGFTQGAKVMSVEVKKPVIDQIPDVVYSQILSTYKPRQLHMSIFVPRVEGLKPAIVYFPGGGFMSANHSKYLEMRLELAKAGFVVAAAEYRTVPDTFPAPVQDAKAAIRYLRAHAKELGIDPTRIGVFGDSAGGWLAQMVGTTNGDKQFEAGDFLDQSSDVQAVATIYGLSNLLTIGEGYSEEIQKVHASPAVTEALLVNGAAFRNFAGASIFSDKDKAMNASPMGHIKGKKPPFLIMHGSSDTLVSPWQSVELYKGLVEGGNQAEYILLEGAEHGDAHWYQPEIFKIVVDHFSETLGNEPKKTGDKEESKYGRL